MSLLGIGPVFKKYDAYDLSEKITLDSSERFVGATNDCRYNLSKTYLNIRSLEVVDFSILNAFFAINGYNGSFGLLETGFPEVAVTIPPGTYDTATFPGVLAAALTAASPSGNVYAVAISPTTLRMTVTLTSGSAPFTYDFSDAYLSPLGLGNAQYVMGYGYPVAGSPAPTPAPATTQVSPYSVHLENTDRIALVFDFYPMYGQISGGSSYTYEIPNDVNFGSVLFYRRGVRQDQLIVFQQPQSIQTFRIQLIDVASGELLNTNGAEYILTLQTDFF